METASAEAAVVQAFTPLCVAKAEQQPEKLVALKEESSYQRDDFVIEAGWVDNVSEKYRTEVATVCASTLVEAMEALQAQAAGKLPLSLERPTSTRAVCSKGLEEVVSC